MTMPKTVLKRRLAVLLFVSIAWFAGSVARAADAKRLGILKFHGPAEGASRNAVGRATQTNHYQIVGSMQIEKTAKKLGVKLRDDSGFVAVAKELGISAFVLGEVTKKKATLTIRNGADGSVAAEASWTGANPRKLAGTVEKTFWRRLGSAIEHSKPPSGAKQAAVAEESAAPEAPADAEETTGAAGAKGTEAGKSSDTEGAKSGSSKAKASSSEQESDSEATATAKAGSSRGGVMSGSGPAPGTEGLDVAVGLGALMRSLSYHQNASGEPKYGLPLGPEVVVKADVFPAIMLGSDGFATRLGLTLGLSALIPGTVSTKPPTGPGSYGTRSLAWDVGLKVRIPYGLFVTGAYGDHAFGLNSTGGAPASLIPTTNYRFVRLGAGGRWRLSPEFSFMANLGYLRVLSFGSIADGNHYPKITGAAVEAGVAAGYRISTRLEARLGADFQRFGLAFNIPFSATPPPRIAGGAYDQYVSLWVGVAMVLGDATGPARKAESAESEAK